MPASSPAPKREQVLETTQVESSPAGAIATEDKVEEILNESPASSSPATAPLEPDTITASNADVAIALLNEQVEEHHASKQEVQQHSKFDKFKNQTKKENK